MEEAYDFGMILQRLRKERGWTQKQLADMINKESSIISRYEKNLQSPTFDTVRSLAAIFNVSMDYLSGMEKSSSVSVFGMDDDRKELVRRLAEQLRKTGAVPSKKMTEEQCALIGHLVEEFIKF